jgi:hypothetical protein
MQTQNMETLLRPEEQCWQCSYLEVKQCEVLCLTAPPLSCSVKAICHNLLEGDSTVDFQRIKLTGWPGFIVEGCELQKGVLAVDNVSWGYGKYDLQATVTITPWGHNLNTIDQKLDRMSCLKGQEKPSPQSQHNTKPFHASGTEVLTRIIDNLMLTYQSTPALAVKSQV